MSIGEWLGADGHPEWVQALQGLASGNQSQRRREMLYACGAQFYLGARGTGSPYHHHNTAWNVLTSGTKRWSLLPPIDGVWSRLPLREMLADRGIRRTLHARLRTPPLKCTQEAGDMMIVPEHWSHQVFNVATSVGIAHEFYHT